MAKDYFQDITPPNPDLNPPRQLKPLPPEPEDFSEPAVSEPDAREVPIRITSAAPEAAADPATRSIRSIQAPSRPRPVRMGGAPSRMDMDIREGSPLGGGLPPRPPRRSSRLWMWAGASVVVLLGVAALLFFFGSTTVTVTPKSNTAILTSAPITAHEGATAPEGTLSYTLQSFDLEDSEVVEASGTTRVETKASGSIVVYNAYSATSVKLVKNTRFESPEGLIFRALADIVIPGRSGSTPGSVTVTVVADEAGEKYNLGPTAKFTVPGLKSTATMYAGVYAKSTEAMTGGFAGDKPGTAPGALEAAIALVRGRLEIKANETLAAEVATGSITLPELMTITYESLPSTNEAGGTSVRIHEKASVKIPVFSSDAFASAVARAAFTDFDNAPVTIRPMGDFSVQALTPEEGSATSALNLIVSGSALIVWKVDTAALTTALQGIDASAFEGVVNAIPSILEAHARIAPFWKSSFPADGADIKVDVVEPKPAT